MIEDNVDPWGDPFGGPEWPRMAKIDQNISFLAPIQLTRLTNFYSYQTDLMWGRLVENERGE